MLSGLAALAYLLLSIIMTYPLAFRLGTSIAGVPDNDSLEFVWTTWWFKRALLELRQNPAEISVLNFPQGLHFPLLPAMAQPFLLSLPLAALSNPITAFNVTYLLSFPLCGVTGYWLCTQVSGDRRAGFLGGLIWAFFPNKTGHALAGHLFQMVVFSLPLGVMFLLRLLRQPSARAATWAGLTLALAATIHPVNVAYFLLPAAIVLVGMEIWSGRSTALATRNSQLAVRPTPYAWKWLSLAALIAAALTAPLFAPALVEAARGRLGFLVTGGTVGFSTDLLAFFLPAPGNPLIAGTPLRALAEKAVLSEFENIAYLGWIPLLLCVLAVRWRRGESQPWLVLAVTASVLSLGPLLKAGGGLVRVPVENDTYPILLPYTLLERVPLFQWSRTPGRLNETVMLGVAALASLGMAALLARTQSRGSAPQGPPRTPQGPLSSEALRPAGRGGGAANCRRPIRVWPRGRGWAIWGVACALIPLEYVVRWPMPTGPIPAPLALQSLARDDSFEAVLNYPVPNNDVNLRGLLQQTVHQHPLVGGRVYRDAPESLVTHDFLSRMIEAPARPDIAPGPTSNERRAALSFYGVGRVVYQRSYDPGEAAGAGLAELLGEPAASDSDLAIYSVKPRELHPSDLFFVFGDNWQAPEAWGEAPGRWFQNVATVYAFSGSARAGALSFTAIPGRDLRRLIVKVNGQEIGYFGVGDWASFRTPEISLQQGLNRIEFIDPDGAWTYVGDPRCQGGSAVAGPFAVAVACDAARQDAGEFSLAIQNLAFVDTPALPPQSAFADTFELLGAASQLQVKTGETLVLHLAWRALRPAKLDYTLFVHLLDMDGNYVTGYDSYPARGQYPTSGWRAGEVVAHNVPLPIPAEASPGSYSIEIGWYDLASGERLLLANGESSPEVGTIFVVGHDD
jgi:hypothetical protein